MQNRTINNTFPSFIYNNMPNEMFLSFLWNFLLTFSGKFIFYIGRGCLCMCLYTNNVGIPIYINKGRQQYTIYDERYMMTIKVIYCEANISYIHNVQILNIGISTYVCLRLSYNIIKYTNFYTKKKTSICRIQECRYLLLLCL